VDFATIIGIIGAFGLVILAMAAGGGVAWFLDGPSAMIVLGGTFGAALIHYRMSDMLGVFRVMKNAFFRRNTRPSEMIHLIVEMSRTARRDGLLSLESLASRQRDPFLEKAVHLMVDGLDPEKVSGILETELDWLAERHRKGADVMTSMGHFAPAMGMMGTLIGLVQMLMKMNDPSAIGPSMAIALVTTFYGLILANLVFLPIAGKLRTRSGEEMLVKQLIIQGVHAIQSGDNPRIVEQKLHAFIAPRERRSRYHE
jgi:chemotaxis protein MotA